MTRALIAGLSVGLALFFCSPVRAEGQGPSLKASDATAQETTPAAPALPPPEVLLVLIRTTLVALNQAVQTGNFTVLRDVGAPSFQAANSSAQLGIIFADLHNRNIDLSPVVVVTPEVSEPPRITPDHLLRLAGTFPTKPLRIEFEMLFQPVNGRWRLYGLAVNAVAPLAATAQATPALPSAQAAPKAANPRAPARKSR